MNPTPWTTPACPGRSVASSAPARSSSASWTKPSPVWPGRSARSRPTSSAPTAILARALGIPAVLGLRGILREVKTGDLIALDGREGHVYLNPGPEVEAAYRKLQREYVDVCSQLGENRELEAVGPDGLRVE